MALRSAESGEREARAIEAEPDDSDEQQSLIPQQGSEAPKQPCLLYTSPSPRDRG